MSVSLGAKVLCFVSCRLPGKNSCQDLMAVTGGGGAKMVLIGLRHFKKGVQGTAFALLYAHRERDTEI